MHKLGSIRSGLDIFNLAIFPALTYNAETWLDTPRKTFDRLENLQYILIRSLLAVPYSAPMPALNWDVGQMSIETFSAKPYLRELSLSQARTKFKLRSRMLEVKNNFQGGRDKTKLLCAACETCVETQDHILFCPS
jgi:hypothetical protein